MREPSNKGWLRRHLVVVLAVKFVFLALLWFFFRHGTPPIDEAKVSDALLRNAPSQLAP